MADNKKNMNDPNQTQKNDLGKQSQGQGQSGQMGTEKRDDSNMKRDVERDRDTTGQKYAGQGQESGSNTGSDTGGKMGQSGDDEDTSTRGKNFGQRSDDKDLAGKSGPGSQER